MLYRIYVVPGGHSWSCHEIIQTEKLIFYSSATVQLRTTRWDMRRDLVNHDEKLELREFCVLVNVPSTIRHVQVPIWSVIPLIQAHPNLIRQAVDLNSHMRLYSPLSSYPHPTSFTVSSTTLPSPLNRNCSHPSLSLHAMILSWHRVQHTPSTAYTKYNYTKYCIHWVQQTTNTVLSQDCLFSFHSHDYLSIPECRFSFRRASLHDRLPLSSSPWQLETIVTLPHCHVCESTN